MKNPFSKIKVNERESHPPTSSHSTLIILQQSVGVESVSWNLPILISNPKTSYQDQSSQDLERRQPTSLKQNITQNQTNKTHDSQSSKRKKKKERVHHSNKITTRGTSITATFSISEAQNPRPNCNQSMRQKALPIHKISIHVLQSQSGLQSVLLK